MPIVEPQRWLDISEKASGSALPPAPATVAVEGHSPPGEKLFDL
jgi:hypothetical protein